MVDWSFLGRRLLGPRLLPPSLYSVDCLYSQHRGFAVSVQVPMARHPEGQAAEGIVHPAEASPPLVPLKVQPESRAGIQLCL